MITWFLVCCASVIVAAKKPNFIVILTDDQDAVLGGMTPMQNVKKFISDEGMTFTNSYTTSPICCPSRASFLTGMYMHNHKTFNNSIHGGCYSANWRQKESATFASLLQEDGYNTFYAGKYLNQYGTEKAGGPTVVPRGWTEWHGLVGNSVYYNYTISNNGVPTHSTDLYLTDVIRDMSISFIENQTETRPFLVVLAPPAPHQPFTPAPRHEGTFGNVTAMRNPSFNIAVKDKHWLMSMPPSPLPENLMPELNRAYRSRWEALLAVDEMVADVVGTLETRALLQNTYLIYTSDNGYHIGQFSQVYDKRQPYETDIKVPFVIKGPGINKAVLNPEPIINIDIAPTILKLAGLTPLKTMDGKPIDLQSGELKERYILIEYCGEGGNVERDCPWYYDAANLSECRKEYACKCQDARNNTYGCIRYISPLINTKYCLFTEKENDQTALFAEAYDLKEDEHELVNMADQMLPALKHWYQFQLSRMMNCKGAECDKPLGNEV